MSETLDANDRKYMLTWAFAYQTLLYKWEQEFSSNPGNGLKKLEKDWGQISHFQRWCAQHLETDNGAAMMCSKFAGVAGNLLNLFLSRLDLIQWREAGLSGARKAELIEDQIGHYIFLSYVHFSNNNRDTALAFLDEAINLADKHKNTKGYATALQHRGMFYAQMNRTAEAIVILEDSLSKFEGLGANQAKTKSLSALATCYSRQNDPQKAIDLYKQAIEIEDELCAIGTYRCNMSGDLIKLERFPEAWSCLEEAEKIANELSDLTLRGLVYTHFGQWHVAQKDVELRSKAWRYYDDALIAFRKKGERYHELQVMNVLESMYIQALNTQSEQLSYEQQSTALRKLIELLFAQGKYTDNLQICNRLLDLAKANQNLPDQLEASIWLGHTALLLKQYDKAIRAHLKGIAILTEIREQEKQEINLKAEGEIQLSLGQAYRHSGNPHEAIRCYERAEKIAEDRHNFDMKYRAVGNRGLIYADTGLYDDAIGLLIKVIEYYEHINNHRLLGHAQFNLAYAYYRMGNLVDAKSRGVEALRYLTIINDSHIDEVKNQIESWEEKND